MCCVGLWWKLLIVYHPLATFNDQRSCGSRDIKYLTCHVFLEKDVITSLYLTNLSNLVAMVTVVVDI